MKTIMSRIVHITCVHYPFDNRIFYKECRSLVEAGYEVHLIAPHEKDEQVEGVYIHAVPKPGTRVERFFRTTCQMYKKARSLRAQLYHFHDPELLLVGYMLSKHKAKVIFDIHENISGQMLSKEWLGHAKHLSRLYSIIEKTLIRKNMYIILAEHSYNKYYADLGIDRITLLNFPRLLSTRAVPHHQCKNAIAYVGGMAPQRGLDQMLEALTILRTRQMTPNLYCIGPFASPEYESEILQHIKSLDLIDQVFLYGRVKSPDALKLVSKARIGLSILHPIPNYYESYSTKVFEYMALGMPFITSDFPIYREMLAEVGDCGVLVDPFDSVGIASAIEHLLVHPKQAAEMGQRGRKAIEEKFNWSFEQEKLVCFYRDILDKAVKV